MTRLKGLLFQKSTHINYARALRSQKNKTSTGFKIPAFSYNQLYSPANRPSEALCNYKLYTRSLVAEL